VAQTCGRFSAPLAIVRSLDYSVRTANTASTRHLRPAALRPAESLHVPSPRRWSARAPAAGAGSAEHSLHTPDVSARSKIGIEKVAPNATALGQLGGDYGIPWPQEVRVTLSAKLQDEDWIPTVTDIAGDYSVQARILPHQADIPDASVATLGNY